MSKVSFDLGLEDDGNAIFSLFEVLDHPSVDYLISALEDKIELLFSRKPTYPVKARIKTFVLFFFVGAGNLTEFTRKLVVNQRHWGEKLGYQRIGNAYWIPAYTTLCEFLKKYLGPVILNNFDIFVKIVIDIAEWYEIRPGWRSCADSTPHESTANDPEAGYSGHYEINGYKEHRLICADTKIPLAYKVTKANEYDGNHIQDLIENVEKGNVQLPNSGLINIIPVLKICPIMNWKRKLRYTTESTKIGR